MPCPARRVSLALVSLLVLLLSSCSGNTSASRTTSEVGAAGATISITSGPLTGVSLTIPAMAVPDGTNVTIDQSAPNVLLGFEVLGTGANFVADATDLAVPGSARLVFDASLLPAGVTAADVSVIRQTSQGRRVVVTPTAVDLTDGAVDVEVETFAAYWVVLQTLRVDAVLANYLPLLGGDTYVFDTGITLTIEDTFDEPNLEGIYVSRARFSDGIGDVGLYWRRELIETLWFGEFSASRDQQLIAIPPLLFLPETGRVGSEEIDMGAAVRYEPYGSPVPVDVLNARVTTTIASQGRLDTPLGRFSDVLEVVFRVDRVDTRGRPTSATYRLWLARGVGPVQIELSAFGPTRAGRLVSAVVDRVGVEAF